MDSKENYFNIKQMTESFKNVKKYSQHSNTILDMFVEISQKLDKSSKDYLSKVIPIDDDKQTLIQVDSIIIMNYFKQIVIYLIKTKVELEERTQQIESQTQYETLIQKLEADIRQHIRIEQQLRIYTETLQQKIDDFIIEREQYTQQIKDYEQKIKQKNKDIVIYQSELRKAVNQNQSRHTKLITEPILEEYDTKYNVTKLNQTNYTHHRKASQFNDEKSILNKSRLNSYNNSPERIPMRKISVTNQAETKAIKQPIFIRQPWYYEFHFQSINLIYHPFNIKIFNNKFQYHYNYFILSYSPMSYLHLKTEAQLSYRSIVQNLLILYITVKIVGKHLKMLQYDFTLKLLIYYYIIKSKLYHFH